MKALAIDPAVRATLRGGVSLLFAWAAIHKVRDRAAFRSALASYELLPSRWIGAFALVVIVLEGSIATGLWVPALTVMSAATAAALQAVYAGAIGINLLRGRRDIDCGCVGVAGKRPLSGMLVGRNAVLIAAALVLALPADARAMTWLDGITITAGVAALALLYAVVDGLLANAPKTAALAGEHSLHRGGRARLGPPHIHGYTEDVHA